MISAILTQRRYSVPFILSIFVLAYYMPYVNYIITSNFNIGLFGHGVLSPFINMTSFVFLATYGLINCRNVFSHFFVVCLSVSFMTFLAASGAKGWPWSKMVYLAYPCLLVIGAELYLLNDSYRQYGKKLYILFFGLLFIEFDNVINMGYQAYTIEFISGCIIGSVVIIEIFKRLGRTMLEQDKGPVSLFGLLATVYAIWMIIKAIMYHI